MPDSGQSCLGFQHLDVIKEVAAVSLAGHVVVLIDPDGIGGVERVDVALVVRRGRLLCERRHGLWLVDGRRVSGGHQLVQDARQGCRQRTVDLYTSNGGSGDIRPFINCR